MRKDLKADALKAAQEKAQNMLAKIDHTIGDIVSVREIDDNDNVYWSRQISQRSMLSNSSFRIPKQRPV